MMIIFQLLHALNEINNILSSDYIVGIGRGKSHFQVIDGRQMNDTLNIIGEKVNSNYGVQHVIIGNIAMNEMNVFFITKYITGLFETLFSDQHIDLMLILH